jgi:hypothetical protein
MGIESSSALEDLSKAPKGKKDKVEKRVPATADQMKAKKRQEKQDRKDAKRGE